MADDLDLFERDESEIHDGAAELQEYSEPKEDSAKVKKCPNCGANLVWSPDDKALKCEYCSTLININMDRFGEELSFAKMLKGNNSWGEDTHVFGCSNCGAKTVVSKTEIAKKCVFCGTTNVVEVSGLSGLKPNAVIPFNLSKEKACERMVKWVKKKIFAPSAFKKSVYPDEIYGNYTPAFTFDTTTYSTYSGVLGEYYYVTKKVGKNVVQERRTRYKSISGNFQHLFDDVLVQASESVSQKTVEKLQPFSTNNCNTYSDEFLHGFTASHYSKDGEECWSEAREKIEAQVKKMILAQYTYDFVQHLDVVTSCNKMTFKYMLLPIYVGHCNWKKKLYNFYVNGRSGKVTGKMPLSPTKVSIASFVGAILLGGIIALVYCIYTGVI